MGGRPRNGLIERAPDFFAVHQFLQPSTGEVTKNLESAWNRGLSGYGKENNVSLDQLGPKDYPIKNESKADRFIAGVARRSEIEPRALAESIRYGCSTGESVSNQM